MIPVTEDRAHLPPEGYHTFYLNHLEMGLRLPVPRFIQNLCDHYKNHEGSTAGGLQETGVESNQGHPSPPPEERAKEKRKKSSSGGDKHPRKKTSSTVGVDKEVGTSLPEQTGVEVFNRCLAKFRANGYSETEHPTPFLSVLKALEDLPEEGEVESSSAPKK
ncbi:hypothetical protein F511_41946 [Dorcoceras hygrometricum]|uniref:Uncharacterized protein n=1 Tax=Dorcoceras hygrometricum TaxID=472368 RepID=A0A2Z7AC09_9LAMI|nr:hypothetical protein F511_41946 [Dorcoceras hygrometricum]